MANTISKTIFCICSAILWQNIFITILNFHLCKGELSKLSGSFVGKWEELYAWRAHPMSIKLNAQEQCSRGETRSGNTPEAFFFPL